MTTTVMNIRLVAHIVLTKQVSDVLGLRSGQQTSFSAKISRTP
jgi:hypothetical protein